MSWWFLAASTAVLAGLLLVVLYTLQNGTVALPLTPAQPTLLLVGPSNAGKTSLFLQVVHDRSETTTHTSQRSNIGHITVESGKKVKVVDVPGHPKLFDSFKSFSPNAIAFVLDASTLAKNVSNVSRNFLEVLTFARKNNVAEVAIFANKADFFTALSKEKIVELIEAELEQIRTQQDGVRMDSIEEKTEEDNDWLQDLSEPYKLSQDVTVFRGSVLKKEIESWQEWINASF